MINKIKEELKNLSDEKYKLFSKKLNPNIDNILGVRLPILRKIAKKIAKNDYKAFFLENDDEFMELTMLEGMVIGNLPYEKQIKYIEKFVPKINNWAICDTFCTGLKFFKTKKHKETIKKYLNSKKEFELRFAFVILLNYFIDDEYDYVLNKISKFNNEQYYAKMAVAWCLSYCIIKNYDKCIKDIQKIKMHSWVFKKGVTKAIESLKLTKIQKDELRKIRQSN